MKIAALIIGIFGAMAGFLVVSILTMAVGSLGAAARRWKKVNR